MAVVLPFAGYIVYRAISGDAPLSSSRHWVGAAIGGYVGINAAALVAAIEFGLQPLLFHTADGTPLYCPYGLSQAIPAMLFAHLTVAGFAEAAVTGGVVAFLQRTMPSLMKLRAKKEVLA